jgi:hypothetical protein
MLTRRQLLISSAAAATGAIAATGLAEMLDNPTFASSSSTLFGICPPGNSSGEINAIVRQLAPKIIHIFEPGQPAGLGSAANVPASIPVFHATTPNLSAVAGRSPSMMNAISAQLRAERDIPGTRVSMLHEPEVHYKTTNPTTFKAAWHVYLDLVQAANAHRTHPLIAVPTFSGWTVDPRSHKSMTTWWPADSRLTEVGFDIYIAGEFSMAAAWARARGLRWCVPEYAYSAQGARPSDSAYLARMKSDTASMLSLSNPPTCVMLFDRSSQSLADQPAAAAFWRNLSITR